MPELEIYEVTVPQPDPSFELKASGVSVGTVTNYKDKLLFVQGIQQRIFVPDMIEGVTAYATSQGFNVDYVVWDSDNDRFEFGITKLNS